MKSIWCIVTAAIRLFLLRTDNYYSMNEHLTTVGLSEQELRQCVKELNEVTKIQCSDGNWNYDPYMHGMANGLILAAAIMANQEPQYLNAPERFISDKKKD